MKLSQLLKDVSTLSAFEDREIENLTDDSRKVRPGSAFYCIQGEHFDGHLAAFEAVQKGAVAILCEKFINLPQAILVENTRKAYSQGCAAFFSHPSAKLRLIGVTGTNGKTTTTFLIKEILDLLGVKAGLIGTVANFIGAEELSTSLTTPECYALQELFSRMVKAGCSYCVMEVSSQALAQERVEGCVFEEAVFTNLTQDHLDYHKTFSAYAAAKAKLFEKSRRALLNLDDAAWPLMRDSCSGEISLYSTVEDADFTATQIEYSPIGVSYLLNHQGRSLSVKANIPGKFSVYNTLAAISTLIDLGFDAKAVVEAVGKIGGVKGRIERLPLDTDFSVIIDYAHSPDGVENILRAVRPITKGRILTVFGCGGDRDKSKRPIMGETAARLSDMIFVTSDNPRSENPIQIIEDILVGTKKWDTPCLCEPSRTEAIRAALKEAKPGDTVLLLGKGHENYQILNTGKIHYDEREIVAGILSGKI